MRGLLPEHTDFSFPDTYRGDSKGSRFLILVFIIFANMTNCKPAASDATGSNEVTLIIFGERYDL
jgi:hypothetical protein